MKKKCLRRFVALAAALLLTLSCFAGCGGTGKKLMTLKDNSLSVNLYELMLSIRKGEMAYAIVSAYGNADSPTFWGTVIDQTSLTYDDYYTAAVLEKAKNYLCALALFDEMGLELPDATVKAVDEEIQKLIEEDGEGSKSKLNSLLADYGANIDILREYKLLTRKISTLAYSLYGQNGSKIGTAVKDRYFEENYVAFKQILLSNFRYLYKTDANGDEIYYREDGSVAYDTVNGTAKPENGSFVYYTEDGRIAYDKENGKRSPVTDEQGNAKTEAYTNDEMLDRLNLAINLRDAAAGESASVFESLRLAYSDEELGNDYDPNALNYLSTAVEYQSIASPWKTLDTLAKKLSETEIGEIAIVQTDAGIHLVRKYPLESGAYENKDNSQWFTDSVYGVYDFSTNLVNTLLAEKLAAYENKITIDTSLLTGLSLKTVKANFYYH